MKSARIATTFVLMFLLFSGSALAATLNVRADNWPPYNGEPTANKPGYMIEVLKEIFEPQGVTIDYKLMPWTRALHEVESGKFDAVVGTDEEEAPSMVFPSEPFGDLVNAMFVAKGTAWRFKGVDSLKNMRLGIIDGYSYDSALDEYIEKNREGGKIFVVTGDDALPKLIKMLNAGRIDAVVEGRNVMNYTLGSLGVEDVVSAGLVGEKSFLHIGLSPNRDTSSDYARMFDEGIAKLRASGRLKTILKSYGVSDWK